MDISEKANTSVFWCYTRIPQCLSSSQKVCLHKC